MRTLRIAACALSLSGCLAGPGRYLKPGFTPPGSVAVLPLSNYTTDLNAPDAVRFWFGYRLSEKKGYRTLPLEIVDAKLLEAGISDGGQLKTLTPQQLGERLGADALVFGDMLEASPLKAEIWDMIWNSIEDMPPGR